MGRWYTLSLNLPNALALYATFESDAVRNLAVENQRGRDRREVPETRAVPTTKASETLSPQAYILLNQITVIELEIIISPLNLKR